MKVLIAIAFAAALISHLAAEIPETPPNAGPTLPEIEAVRAPYLKSIAAIRSARDARVAVSTHTYVASLERLRRDSTTIGDLKSALAIKAKSERVACQPGAVRGRLEGHAWTVAHAAACLR